MKPHTPKQAVYVAEKIVGSAVARPASYWYGTPGQCILCVLWMSPSCTEYGSIILHIQHTTSTRTVLHPVLERCGGAQYDTEYGTGQYGPATDRRSLLSWTAHYAQPLKWVYTDVQTKIEPKVLRSLQSIFPQSFGHTQMRAGSV